MRHVTRSLTTAALAALLSCPVAVIAQQPDQPQTRQPGQSQAQQPGQATQRRAGESQHSHQQAKLSDGQLAAALILANQKEIALAELASQQAQDEKVKAFAQKMIKDHRQFAQSLQSAAESAGISAQQLSLTSSDRRASATPQNRPQDDSADAKRTTDAQRAEERTTDAPRAEERTTDAQRAEERTTRQAARPELNQQSAGAGQGADFVQINRELAAATLQSTRQELQEKSGAEFDKCYMTGQVMAHMYMTDKLQVLSKHVSPELQQTLQKGQQTTKQHLEEAKQLAKQLEESSQKKD
jgi:predicted outer membrane protein